MSQRTLREARASIELYEGEDNDFNPLLSPAPISKDEMTHILWLAVPLVGVQFLEFLPNTVNGMLMGHFSNQDKETRLYLAAGGLSNLYYTVFAFGLVSGVCTAMDALCAQAFGKGMKGDIAYILQTAIVCALAIFIPIALLLAFASVLLGWMGQADEVASVVQNFTRWMILEVPGTFAYEILKRVLQGQNIVFPIVLAIVIGNIVNAIASYTLMYHTDMGYAGWTLSYALVYLVAALSLIPAVNKLKQIHFREGLQWQEIRHRLPYFIYLSLNGWGLFVFEYFAVAFTGFLAGGLPQANLAMSANSIFLGFRTSFSMIYHGIGIAASIRVGNALGGNLPVRAKTAAWQTLGMAIVWGIVTTIAMFVLGPLYAKAYTNDEAIYEATKRLFWATAPFQVANGIWSTVQGVFRGSGKPDKGVWMNFIAFFIIGMPLGHILAVSAGWGIIGLWIGVMIGFTICAIYGLYWLINVDWNDLVLEVDEKLHL
ncbi:Multidrug/Oligosaccharidyl-lipid/Polysaccharide (MOP) Flippase Superfamily [Thraustotheca clavata]|uniref:Multidrug/Oligosaccharidyl-lipid/Polysaccharide (MOP) Flippase Superfamily n=1 Tax=Thraustotheca clavata TaxID=74557 RepID=A0A1V9Z235_9STRA|nr:Multidrug/Oligosaccharidyl-lipid/Polysaccharide (MOP) Flippase Superfamily [Thraustotheca clavata]